MKKTNPVINKIGILGMVGLSGILLAGCNQESDRTQVETPANQDNVQSITTVLNYEFTAPDEAFNEVKAKAEQQTQGEMTEEDYQEYLKTEEVEILSSYLEENVSPYFTEKGFEQYINTLPAYVYHTFKHDYTLAVTEISTKQNAAKPEEYNFDFEVDYQTPGKETEDFEFTGTAIIPEAGQIDDLRITDVDGLKTQLEKDQAQLK